MAIIQDERGEWWDVKRATPPAEERGVQVWQAATACLCGAAGPAAVWYVFGSNVTLAGLTLVALTLVAALRKDSYYTFAVLGLLVLFGLAVWSYVGYPVPKLLAPPTAPAATVAPLAPPVYQPRANAPVAAPAAPGQAEAPPAVQDSAPAAIEIAPKAAEPARPTAEIITPPQAERVVPSGAPLRYAPGSVVKQPTAVPLPTPLPAPAAGSYIVTRSPSGGVCVQSGGYEVCDVRESLDAATTEYYAQQAQNQGVIARPIGGQP